MGLTEQERKQLEDLNRKAKEPDRPSGAVAFTLDLGNDSAWERAQQLGIVPTPENGKKDDDEEEEETPPRRRGYFPSD